MRLRIALAALLVATLTAPVAFAVTPVDLSDVLDNFGFEEDLDHSGWVSTRKSRSYRLDAPVVNPTIVPNGKTDALEAPNGVNFIGVSNPGDHDVAGRLVHDVAVGVHPAGTVFIVTVFANRGRLPRTDDDEFTNSPSELGFQLFAWGPGKLPVISRRTDNWSRRPKVTISRAFTDWAPNGDWASQTFEITVDVEIHYLSFGISARNHVNASYVAFDLQAGP
jgi:hypothetical protein